MGVLSEGRNRSRVRVSVRVSVSIRIGILSYSQRRIQKVDGDGDGLLSAVSEIHNKPYTVMVMWDVCEQRTKWKWKR
jgi:hypothetical protein